MKHQALFYTFCIVGLVVLILLGFTLYLGWPTLMTLAPIILFVGGAALCALIVIGVVFTGFMAFSHGRRHYLHTNRFVPNESNVYPAYLDQRTQTFLQPENGALPYPDGMHVHQGSRAGQETKIEEIVPPLRLPSAPPFSQVESSIYENHLILCYNDKGPIEGTVDDLLSTLVVGKPGLGKSTGLYFFIAMLMYLKAEFKILDPHASLISLKGMLPYTNKMDEIIAQALVVERELTDRMDRYEQNGGKCLDDHYMLVVDELPAIADAEDQLRHSDDKARRKFRSLIAVIRRIVMEGRKYKMYCMVVGQSVPANILPTTARDNMSTRYVFYCSDDHARMAGLDSKAIKEFLPRLPGQQGKCIVAPARMEPFIGAIPHTTVSDLRRVIETTSYAVNTDVNTNVNTVNELEDALDEAIVNSGNNISAFPRNMRFAPDTEVSLETVNSGNTPPPGVTQEKLDQIKKMWEANWSLRDISKVVKLEGRNYGQFMAACRYLGIKVEA